MEYMDGLSLDIVQQIVGRVEEKHAGHIAISVIQGLAYLKDQFNILHRGQWFLCTQNLFIKLTAIFDSNLTYDLVEFL